MAALGHFHLYKDAKWCALMTESSLGKPMPHEAIKRDVLPRNVDFSTWEPWSHIFEPGDYYVCEKEIEDVREEFHATRRIPKAILKGQHAMKRLLDQNCLADPFERGVNN